jgi:hypothetical protein
VRYDNLYPCENFTVDFLVKYEGSIPVHLKAIADGDQMIQDLVQLGADTAHLGPDRRGIWVEGYHSCQFGHAHSFINTIDDVQMHEGDYILANLVIHLPQEQDGPFSQALMEDQEWYFNIHLFAVQWNESDIFDPFAVPHP